MTNKTIQPPQATTVPNPHRRAKFAEFLRVDDDLNNSIINSSSDDASSSTSSSRHGSNTSTATPPSPTTTSSSPRLSVSDDGVTGGSINTTESTLLNSPYNNNMIMSPWNQPSPYIKSPWKKILPSPPPPPPPDSRSRSALLGSLLREEGHVYSLAASDDMLYTGSDSKNVRVWKNFKDLGGFKSNSGLVKAIIIAPAAAAETKNGGNYKLVFTGHQDGKIRVWKSGSSNYNGTKRIGSLPTLTDYIKNSINPKKYVKVRRNRKVPGVRHFDAVSCLSLNPKSGLLYSGSWDKTIKVWRLSDSKCLESINQAHDDAINSIAVSPIDGLVFSGSADGTVKVWRQELNGKRTSHIYVQTLLSHDSAITSLAVSGNESQTVYCGSSDGLVNFWEREKGWLCYGGVLRGHKLAVLCLATVGESLVFSGSADKSICVWKREEGGAHSCVSVLTGHSGPVKCLAVEEDRTMIEEEEEDDDDQEVEDACSEDDRSWIVYSGSLDKSVKVWRVYENE